MSLQIVKQPHRDIYGINNSTHVLLCSAITTRTTPITYTWEVPNDDGDFVTFTPTTDEVIAPSNVITVKITSQTMGRAYQCRVSDGVQELVTDFAFVTFIQKWYSGPTDQIVVQAQPNSIIPVTQDTSIRGGLHIYENLQELCNASANYQRVKYGMLALLKESDKQQRIFRFNTYDPITKFSTLFSPWVIGVDWIEMPVMSVDDVDGDTIQIIDNKLVAAGIPPDNKTIVIQDGVLSAVPYDQDLNTFNSVKFHDVTTNVVIENTMAIQTYAYATSSTVGRNSLSAINNSEATQGSIGGTTFAFNSVDYNYSVTGFADTTFPTLTLVRGRLYSFDLTNVSSSRPFALRLTNGGSTTPVPGTTNNDVNNGAYNVTITYQVPLDAPSVIYYQCTSFYQMVGTINIVNPGPYNVLEVTANSKKYIPLDLTRANTFLLTLSDASNSIGTYDGFVLINKAPLTSSFDVSLDANTTYQTFIEPDSIKGKIYTITLFVKHLNVMSTLPLKLYSGTVETDASRIADDFSVTQIPVKWSAGSYPALYTTLANPNYILGSEDVIMYTTYDAGATWYGFIGGTDLR